MTEKREFRALARARRAQLAAAMPDFAGRLAAHAASLELTPGTLVGGYFALPGEADPSLLLEKLEEAGHAIALPRVAAKDAALVFHRVVHGAALMKGAFGISEPPPHAPLVRPDILLVPLLAFDETGHRLGYGGGFYDRTLAALRQSSKGSHRVRAVGIAYGGQEVTALPREAHDHPLDAILTETGIRVFA